MESKTVLLAFLGFGVAAYVAYQLGKGGAGESKPSQDAPAQPSPPPSGGPGPDEGGGNLFPGLSGMDESVLCRLAPSLCAWRIPSPLPVVPMFIRR